MYGFMLLVFIILMIVTACVTVVGTYFLLNAENYHWQVRGPRGRRAAGRALLRGSGRGGRPARAGATRLAPRRRRLLASFDPFACGSPPQRTPARP